MYSSAFWHIFIAVLLLSLNSVLTEESESRPFLQRLLGARKGETNLPPTTGKAVCAEPNLCVAGYLCTAKAGDAVCDDEKVCCAPDNVVPKVENNESQIKSETEFSDKLVDAVQMRSASGNFFNKPTEANSLAQSNVDKPITIDHPGYSTVTARQGSGYGHFQSHGHNHPESLGSYRLPYNPNPHQSYEESYPSPPPIHISYNHAYGGDLGHFAPDYYGPNYDSTSLSTPAREVLQKYRYKECGAKSAQQFVSDESYEGQFGPYEEPPKRKFAQNPWQAAVLGWSEERGYGLRCSATIVHSYLLIASAHCLSGIVEPELKVLLGVSDLLEEYPVFPAIERPVARILVHEKYDSQTLTHDVAVLQLASEIDFNWTPHVAPACLPKINQTFVVSNCYILGWTDVDSYEGPDVQRNELQITDMQFISDSEQCQTEVSRYARNLNPSKLTNEMHCIKGNKESTCFGLSGGALFCDVPTSETPNLKTNCPGHNCGGFTAYLAGILSWSNERCGGESLGIVTELSPYVSWVNNLLKDAGGLENFNPDYYGGSARNYGYRQHENEHSHSYAGGYGNYGHGHGPIDAPIGYNNYAHHGVRRYQRSHDGYRGSRLYHGRNNGRYTSGGHGLNNGRYTSGGHGLNNGRYTSGGHGLNNGRYTSGSGNRY